MKSDLAQYLPQSVLRQLRDEGYRIVKIEEYQPDLSPALQGDDCMAQADNAILADIRDELNRIAARLDALEERLNGKDLNPELYGETPDHAADRAARAAFAPKPRPPR